MRGVNIIHDREKDRVGFTTPSEQCFSKHTRMIIDYAQSTDTMVLLTTMILM